MFRSLKEHSSTVTWKQQSACAENILLVFWRKNIVVFVGISSWNFCDFGRKSLVFYGKCFGSVLKIDFYLTRGTFWAKCFEKFREYKVCILSLSERLIDRQQKICVKIFKGAFCLEEQFGSILRNFEHKIVSDIEQFFAEFNGRVSTLFSKMNFTCAAEKFGFI